jgi:hypothetical protein
MRIKEGNLKKGQVTVFVIIGILIVLAIVIFFLIKFQAIPNLTRRTTDTNPHSFLHSCIEQDLKDTLELISSQGGYVKNKLNITFQFGDEQARDISYLCYNQNNYLPCINHEPMLLSHLKKEIKQEIKQEVRDCFDSFGRNLVKEGYVVDASYRDFNVDFFYGKVLIDIDASISLTKAEETRRVEDFRLEFPSKFYDILIVVHEIVSQEARFCSFQSLGYMTLNPKINIDKFITGKEANNTIFYKVEHRESREKFRFVIRGCVIPPGL